MHNRYITHNIMVCQDIIRSYGRMDVKPSCIMKLDMKKAYDTINWDFLEEMMQCFIFHRKFIKLVMACVRTHSFFSDD